MMNVTTSASVSAIGFSSKVWRLASSASSPTTGSRGSRREVAKDAIKNIPFHQRVNDCTFNAYEQSMQLLLDQKKIKEPIPTDQTMVSTYAAKTQKHIPSGTGASSPFRPLARPEPRNPSSGRGARDCKGTRTTWSRPSTRARGPDAAQREDGAPGDVSFHASNVPHSVVALEDLTILSIKHLVNPTYRATGRLT